MFLEKCRTYPLKNKGKWSIQGHSVAGFSTGFILGPMKWGLDAGIYTRKKLGKLFLTHQHMDHTQALPQITARHDTFDSTKPKQPIHIFMPQSVELPVRKYMEGVIALSARETTPLDCSEKSIVWDRQCYMPVPVEAGQTITVDNVSVEILRAYHGHVETVGYGFKSIHKRLKDEFTCSHIEGRKVCSECKQNIMEARKRKENIHQLIYLPELVFFCDSTIDNLTLHHEWQSYPVIMCECTHYGNASSSTHTDIKVLKPIMLAYSDKQWILLHASQSYSSSELDAFEKELHTSGLDVIIIRE